MAQDTLAHYRATTMLFVAPEKIKEGQSFWVDADWPPNPYVEPLNPVAEEAMAKFNSSRPEGWAADSLEALPNNFGPMLDEFQAEPDDEPVISLAEASTIKAKPGLDQGGRAVKTS